MEDSETPTSRAGEPRNCVYIIQRESAAALVYSDSNDQVFTDPNWSPSDSRMTWCMTIPGPSNLHRSRFYPYDFQNTKELDAYETAANDYNVVLRPRDGNDPSKVWRVNPELSLPFSSPIPAGVFRISQLNTGRYLDAYDSPPRRAVTRDFQYNDTQRWVFKTVAGCTCDPL